MTPQQETTDATRSRRTSLDEWLTRSGAVLAESEATADLRADARRAEIAGLRQETR